MFHCERLDCDNWDYNSGDHNPADLLRSDDLPDEIKRQFS